MVQLPLFAKINATHLIKCSPRQIVKSGMMKKTVTSSVKKRMKRMEREEKGDTD